MVLRPPATIPQKLAMNADDSKAIETIAGLIGVVVAMALLAELIGGLVAIAAFSWICWKAISSAVQRPRHQKAAAEDRARKQQEYEKRLLEEFCLPDTEEARQLIRDWREHLRHEPIRDKETRANALDALARAGFEQPEPRTLREANEELERRYGINRTIEPSSRTAFLAWVQSRSVDGL